MKKSSVAAVMLSVGILIGVPAASVHAAAPAHAPHFPSHAHVATTTHEIQRGDLWDAISHILPLQHQAHAPATSTPSVPPVATSTAPSQHASSTPAQATSTPVSATSGNDTPSSPAGGNPASPTTVHDGFGQIVSPLMSVYHTNHLSPGMTTTLLLAAAIFGVSGLVFLTGGAVASLLARRREWMSERTFRRLPVAAQ